MSARYLITDSVPLNGGDEAMLRALIESIHARWPRVDITVLCKDVDRCRSALPDLTLDSDLTFVENSRDAQAATARIRGLYASADLVISSPGGFLNDYYEIDGRLRGMEMAIECGTPVVLFGQSIGPFWNDSSRQSIARVLNRCSIICVRDALSVDVLRACGVDPAKIHRTTDVVFLWRQLAPDLYPVRSTPAGPVRSIGLCFRLWPLHDRDMHEHIVACAVELTRHLLQDDPARRVSFLSTCQGVEEYKDDSEVAEHIVERLPPELQERCSIDRHRYPPRELIRRLGRYDAFIGMRLHACLLAMLGGCPAMGLGYESKTSAIFSDLGFSANQIDYDQESAAWIERAAKFLDSLDETRSALPAALDAAAARVEEYLALLDPALVEDTTAVATT